MSRLLKHAFSGDAQATLGYCRAAVLPPLVLAREPYSVFMIAFNFVVERGVEALFLPIGRFQLSYARTS